VIFAPTEPARLAQIMRGKLHPLPPQRRSVWAMLKAWIVNFNSGRP
jgi:hypothetical protein